MDNQQLYVKDYSCESSSYFGKSSIFPAEISYDTQLQSFSLDNILISKEENIALLNQSKKRKIKCYSVSRLESQINYSLSFGEQLCLWMSNEIFTSFSEILISTQRSTSRFINIIKLSTSSFIHRGRTQLMLREIARHKFNSMLFFNNFSLKQRICPP